VIAQLLVEVRALQVHVAVARGVAMRIVVRRS